MIDFGSGGSEWWNFGYFGDIYVKETVIAFLDDFVHAKRIPWLAYSVILQACFSCCHEMLKFIVNFSSPFVCHHIFQDNRPYGWLSWQAPTIRLFSGGGTSSSLTKGGWGNRFEYYCSNVGFLTIINKNGWQAMVWRENKSIEVPI